MPSPGVAHARCDAIDGDVESVTCVLRFGVLAYALKVEDLWAIWVGMKDVRLTVRLNWSTGKELRGYIAENVVWSPIAWGVLGPYRKANA